MFLYCQITDITSENKIQPTAKQQLGLENKEILCFPPVTSLVTSLQPKFWYLSLSASAEFHISKKNYPSNGLLGELITSKAIMEKWEVIIYLWCHLVLAGPVWLTCVCRVLGVLGVRGVGWLTVLLTSPGRLCPVCVSLSVCSHHLPHTTHHTGVGDTDTTYTQTHIKDSSST